MLKPKKKISKKELKQDTLVTSYVELTSFYEQYKKYISYALTGIALIVVAVFIYTNNRRTSNDKASAELGKIFSLYDAGSNDASQYRIAINGQPERGIMGLKSIVDNYGSTDAGELARFYLANSYYNIGQIDDALTQFDKFSGGEKLLQASALAGMASCYEIKKVYDKAASYYEKAANTVSNAVSTPEYLHFAARCYGLSGDKEKAVALYKRLKKEFPSSNYGRDADRYIAQFAA